MKMKRINSRNVKKVFTGTDFIINLNLKLNKFKNQKILFIIDSNLKKFNFENLNLNKNNQHLFIKIKSELTTNYVDILTKKIKKSGQPDILVGIGGGTILDCTKAVSILLTNSKAASYYQGWDLVKNKGVYKIGIPSLSGTGAESSKTCVLLNLKKKLKLGFNSKFTPFDEVLLFPELIKNVPKKLFFITGTDIFFHSFELLNGKKRNKYADQLANESLKKIKSIFLSKNIKSDNNLNDIMSASFMAGEAISRSMVGVIHPFSAGLSTVFGIPHCLANCYVFRGLGMFYPYEFKLFNQFIKIQKIRIPKLNFRNLSISKLNNLYNSTIIHEKPLINALGVNYKNILTKEKVFEIFRSL